MSSISGFRGTTEERFWKYVEPEPNSGCWLWIGGTNLKGYGRFWDGEKMVLPQRFSYEAFRGPIPESFELDHLCRVPPCVNPVHLEPVPQTVNILRGVGWGAQNARKSMCPHGHLYDRARREGGRFCSVCKRNRDKGRVR